MTNTQFTFRRSWLEAINLIKAKSVRSRLLTAIVEYGLNRTYTPIGNTAADAIMLLIIDQINSAEEATTSGDDRVPFGGDSGTLSQEFTDSDETYRRDAGTPDKISSHEIVHRALSIVNRPTSGGDSVPLSQGSTYRSEMYRRDAGTPGESRSPEIEHRALSIVNRLILWGDSVPLSQDSTVQSDETYRRDAGTPKPKEVYKKKSRSKKKKRLARRRKHRR